VVKVDVVYNKSCQSREFGYEAGANNEYKDVKNEARRTASEIKHLKPKIILDLCGGTGAWSKPYANSGYDVKIITFPQYDVRFYKPPNKVYGILAAPPCTHLAVSGARWWKKKGISALFEALAIIDACMRIILLAQPKFWALENPTGRLIHYLGKPTFTFNPCDYGDPYTKRTCLWGEFNIPKKNPVDPINKNFIHYIGPGPNRQKKRSITPSGFAKAFFEANQ